MTLWLKQNIPYIQHCLHVAKTHKTMKHLDIRSFMTGSPQAIQYKPRPKNQGRKHPKSKSILLFTTIQRKRPAPQRCTKTQSTKYYKTQDKPPDRQKPADGTKSLCQTNLFETLFNCPRNQLCFCHSGGR